MINQCCFNYIFNKIALRTPLDSVMGDCQTKRSRSLFSKNNIN
jgi:hypothetical protein